ncbi:hypothetical protein BC943DRAFT_361268 [Umbelopsis sp. AD052]|nr:hypothetical protein BC943DRAFT_361268 [Umbelopsis sp. AD052]
MYQSSDVRDYNLDTVVNRTVFTESLEFKNCPDVGPSLIAKSDLKAGTKVLIEKPIISYELNPKGRSSVSPQYTKKIWNDLCAIVLEIEQEQTPDVKIASKSSGYDSDERDSDSEYEDDEDDEDSAKPVSAFCPGVPAAMVAYLSVSPPPTSNQRTSPQMCDGSKLNFFYYPDLTEWADHPTTSLIRRTVEKATVDIPAFSHIQPADLISFVLKIYCNAHTVAYENNRTLQTHSKRKQRRVDYQRKIAVSGSPLEPTFWPSEPGSRMLSKIILLPWGSKFAHSCSPNMFLRYEPATGTMILTLTSDVKKGELLTFSYLPEDDTSLGGLLCGTTQSRRQKTWHFKFFHCNCDRCIDIDWARGVQCQKCSGDRCFREGGVNPDEQRQWICLDCKAKFNVDDIEFIACGREHNVQQVAIAFGVHVKGTPEQSMIRMMEPYLMSLLDPSTDPYDSDGELKDPVPPIPRNHWTFAYFHYLLSAYHLQLFPAYFSRGLAKQLEMLEKGFNEAYVYIDWLDKNLFTAPSTLNGTPEVNQNGTKMASFIASWHIVDICIDVLLEETNPKVARKVKEDDSEDSSESEDNAQLDESMSSMQIHDGTQLQPIAPSCLDACVKMVHIMQGHWIPLIETLFDTKNEKDPSNLTVIMLTKIRQFIDRVQQLQDLNI